MEDTVPTPNLLPRESGHNLLADFDGAINGLSASGRGSRR